MTVYQILLLGSVPVILPCKIFKKKAEAAQLSGQSIRPRPNTGAGHTF